MTKGGDALTDKEVEALAAEAERDYKLSVTKQQRLGRPSLESTVSPRVSVRTSFTLYQAARARAAKEAGNEPRSESLLTK